MFKTSLNLCFSVILLICLTSFTSSAQDSKVVIALPANVAGNYASMKANFGPELTVEIEGPIVAAEDISTTPITACDEITKNLNGSIALIDRGECYFMTKVQNAQAAGAIAVIVCDSVVERPNLTLTMGLPPGSTGTQIDIPSVMVSYNSCKTIRAELCNGLMGTLSPSPGGETCDEALIIGPGLHTTEGIPSGGGAIFSDAVNALWYSYTPVADGMVVIRSCGFTDKNTRLFILDNPNCDESNLDIITFNDNCSPFDTASEVSVNVVGGTEYFIYWDNRWSSDRFDFQIVEFSDSYEDLIISENLDTLSQGKVSSQSDFWFFWGDDAQADGLVSNEQFFSPPYSLILGTSSQTLRDLSVSNYPSDGEWVLKFKLYIEAGQSAHYNIREEASEAANENFAIDFNSDGTISEPGLSSLGNYPQGEWFEVLHRIDLDNETITLFVEGQRVLTKTYLGPSIGGLYLFNSIGIFYVDDIELSRTLTDLLIVEPGDTFILDISNILPDERQGFLNDLEEQEAIVIDSCACEENMPTLLELINTSQNPIIIDDRVGAKGESKVDTSNVPLVLDPLESAVNNSAICIHLPIDVSTFGTVNIAVTDTGIDFLGHTDLANLNWLNPGEFGLLADFDDDEDCWIDNISGIGITNKSMYFSDEIGHGTHIAGIIARALLQNPGLKLMDYKVYSHNNKKIFNLYCGLKEAVLKGAQIVNLSLGFFDEEIPEVLYSILKLAEQEGVLVVVSAGNAKPNKNGQDLKQFYDPLTGKQLYRWPGAFKIIGEIDPTKKCENLTNLIVVGALDEYGEKYAPYAHFSNDIVSFATIGGFRSTYLNNSYRALQGTSMAAAFVTHLAGLALAQNPNLTPEEIIECLKESVEIIPTMETKVITGGKLDVLGFFDCFGIEYEGGVIVDPPNMVNSKIFPTPFRESVNIIVKDERNEQNLWREFKIQIFDANGREIFHEQCQGNSITWNGKTNGGAEAAAGIYFCKITVNGVCLTEKIIKT